MRAAGPPSDARQKRFLANAVVCLSEGELSTTGIQDRGIQGSEKDSFTSASGRGAYNLVLVTESSAPNLRVRLRRMFFAAILTILGVSVLAFGVDYAVFRLRVAANWSAYGSVTVNHYTAVLQKNGKTSLTFDPPQDWTCVNALFPHEGCLPCWYLRRHPDQRTDI